MQALDGSRFEPLRIERRHLRGRLPKRVDRELAYRRSGESPRDTRELVPHVDIDAKRTHQLGTLQVEQSIEQALAQCCRRCDRTLHDVTGAPRTPTAAPREAVVTPENLGLELPRRGLGLFLLARFLELDDACAYSTALERPVFKDRPCDLVVGVLANRCLELAVPLHSRIVGRAELARLIMPRARSSSPVDLEVVRIRATLSALHRVLQTGDMSSRI